MLLRTDNPKLLTRLAALMGLKLLTQSDNFLVGGQVVPVVDVAWLVKDGKCAQVAGNISGALGTYVAFHSVPLGKRWTLRGAAKTVLTVNDTHLAVNLPGYADMAIANGRGLSILAYEFQPIVLPAGSSVGLYTNATTASVTLSILYDEEDAAAQ